jgi:hypothetical protein
MGIRSGVPVAISRSASVDGHGSVRSNPKMTISEGGKGTATVVIRIVGLFHGALNGGFKPGVEPRSLSAGTRFVPIPHSCATLEGKRKGLLASGTMHVVLAVWTF